MLIATATSGHVRKRRQGLYKVNWRYGVSPGAKEAMKGKYLQVKYSDDFQQRPLNIYFALMKNQISSNSIIFNDFEYPCFHRQD